MLNWGGFCCLLRQSLYYLSQTAIENQSGYVAMRKHNGMRPQDVVILLWMVTRGESPWKYADASRDLHISQSEVAEALHRSLQARLVNPGKKKVHRAALTEFLLHGLKYVFPASPGALVRGIPTAHSAPPLAAHIVSHDDVMVWPSSIGQLRGQAVSPLYPSVLQAIQKNQDLYELLAVVDAIRTGRAHELKIAEELLRERVYTHEYTTHQHP